MINEHDINDHECALYELTKGAKFKLDDSEAIKVPVSSNQFKINDIFKFERIDGMYSRCFDSEGALHHFAAWTKVKVIHE
jgi:hypothetical protein